jgi:lysylphosphatidylglycerol synthetase-like protein (DUF2156 family)
MLYLDLAFYLAVGALGWGLSLATYRSVAARYDWPMGHWHRNRPALPILIGLAVLAAALLFTLARGYSNVPGAGWNALVIVVCGVLLALLWTMVLRVASQVSLVLAPVAGALLMVWWIGGPDALEYQTVRSEIRDLREALEESGVLSAPRRDDSVAPRR